jgi:class 3 adenylate cyclase
VVSRRDDGLALRKICATTCFEHLVGKDEFCRNLRVGRPLALPTRYLLSKVSGGDEMPEDRVDRRLAAILAADIAGYSRLMGFDEEGTLRQLKGHRKELVDPKITEHRGRVVKTTGDGMLVEFVSVVDAVRCAVDIQRGMVERNAEVQPESRLQFRVGINVGDIISDENDIYGDGSTWRLGWRRWPTPAASWFRVSCTTRCRTSSASTSTISESRPSRTSRGQSAFTAFI